MAEQPDRPDESAGAAIPPHEPAAPPVNEAPVVKKATPAKKAPAKKPAAKRAPAKKAAAKKPPAKKAPTKAAPAATTLANSNGSLAPTAKEAAKETAAQAKSTVTAASNTVSSLPVERAAEGDSSRLPVAAALITALLAIVAVLYLARRGSR